MQEGWKPIRLGEKLLVKFTWHGESDVRPLLEATPGLQLMTLEGASSSSSLLLHVNTEMARMESLTDGPMCVYIPGGAAFGSGEHATTTMCCEWLERRLQKQEQGAPLSMIDYGSGSGILGACAHACRWPPSVFPG